MGHQELAKVVNKAILEGKQSTELTVQVEPFTATTSHMHKEQQIGVCFIYREEGCLSLLTPLPSSCWPRNILLLQGMEQHSLGFVIPLLGPLRE